MNLCSIPSAAGKMLHWLLVQDVNTAIGPISVKSIAIGKRMKDISRHFDAKEENLTLSTIF
jgi:hypothetical protein